MCSVFENKDKHFFDLTGRISVSVGKLYSYEMEDFDISQCVSSLAVV